MAALVLFSTLLCLPTTLAQSYSLTDTYSGSNFFNKFDFFTGADPTEGYVDYCDYETSVARGLIPNANVASWGVDHTTVMSPSNTTGRGSVRLSSKTTYNHGLFVADIAHMPDSTCGLWPAYWFLGQTGTWPNSGEVDVIEGVNNAKTNLISGHTKAGCSIAGTGQLGKLQAADCAVPDGTTGCGTSDSRTNSYGTGFNAGGGGVYAMDWTSSSIQVWFFARGSIPASITSGNPNPASDFGTPTAVLAGACNIDEMFFDMSITFDTTFCGSWAGNDFQTDSCPMTGGGASLTSCNAYVAENPTAFANAYWTINSIKVYSQSGNTPAATTNAQTTATNAKSTTLATQTSPTIPTTIVVSPIETTSVILPTTPAIVPTVATTPTTTAAADTTSATVDPAQTSTSTFSRRRSRHSHGHTPTAT